jgi:hypothetical protein
VDYIITFIKLKAEANGYPSWVRSPESEERYIQSFRESEGIELDKASIKYNTAKRRLAKLCLKSIWGKRTERNNRTHSKLISDPEEPYRFLATPGIEVVHLVFAIDEVVWVSWNFTAEERVGILRHTNEVIGAYVSAGAKINLYRYLDRLQEKTIYCDTDSVIFIQPRDEPRLVETGDNFGYMTSELNPYEIISEFVSAGPKNYAYTILDT